MSNYGQIWAMRRAKALQERRDAEAEKKSMKPKKDSPYPKVTMWPMRSYKPEMRQRSIDWDDEQTVNVSGELHARLSRDMPRMALLSMPTGTGKTSAAVETLGRLQTDLGHTLPFIVSAPRAVVEQGGWHETIAWWNECHPDNALDPWLITTPDKLASLLAHKLGVGDVIREMGKDGVIVLDEAHGFKNPTSKRAKMMQRVGHLRKLALTATPLTNDPVMDGASYLILAGYYRNKTDFMKRNGLDRHIDKYYRLAIYDERGRVMENMWPKYPEFKSDLAAVIHKPDIDMASLDLPNVRERVWQLPHDDALDADMRSLATAWRQRMFDSATDLMLASFERLCEDEPRIKKAVEICSAKDVHQPLIFYWHTKTGDVLEAAFAAAGFKNLQRVDGNQKLSDVDVALDAPILMQYQAGAEGIEFKLSDTTVFYEPQGSWSKLQQAKGRNVRRGMTHTVRQHYILADCHFDHLVNERLRQHDEVNDKMMCDIVAEALDVKLT